jgi:tetratricopeptide (TPR) repeat protein
MNDSDTIQALKLLADSTKGQQKAKRKQVAGVRVSPGGYLAAASVLTFSSVLLLRADKDLWALATIAIAWLVIPALAFTDRIVFDGESMWRRGVTPLVWQFISGRKQRLSVADFERVDTNALRTLRRGGRVRYRYSTQIIGKGISFVIASGGKRYRQMVRQLFPLVHDQKIDIRTRELRDYLCETDRLAASIEQSHLAPADVLDNADSDIKKRPRNRPGAETHRADDIERAQLLRRLANQLRVAGRLRESREAFRRALIVLPRDAGLIYEFARLLRSQASAMGDARLLSRARAALRLSCLRAEPDSALLSSIGESMVECGDVDRAERVFRRALDIDSRNFRARMELADLALRNGKLAHVIHHYRDGAQLAPDKALAAYARREGEYYARLNDDEDYLVRELRRIGWLQNATRVRRLAARVTNASILIALIGPYIDPTVAGIGWSLACSSLLAWISALFARKILADRRGPRPAE